MPSNKKLLQAAAGSAGGDNLYVEDVFSTYLYAGNGAYQTITNGIDLLNEGGLVWGKSRTTADRNNYLWDTERGYTSGDTNFSGHTLSTNTTTAEQSGEHVRNIYEDGYQSWGGYHINMSSQDYVSWTFRKQAGFFDVVTYTGDGTGPRAIAHNLGCKPGCIIIKNLDQSYGWAVWVQSFDVNEFDSAYILLNTTAASTYSGTPFVSQLNVGSRDPSANFYVKGDSLTNANGIDYVAYLFADGDDAAAQIFGDDGDESIIKCGSYTGNNASTANVINVGFEPQWIMIKGTDRACNWIMVDVMRGASAAPSTSFLEANTSDAEATSTSGFSLVHPTATGFSIPSGVSGQVNEFNENYIYIAIRRPMKTPESGTEVFSPYAYSDANLTSGSGTASNRTIINGGSNGGSGFPVDQFWHQKTSPNSNYGFHIFDRLRGKGKGLLTKDYNAAPAGDSASNSGFDFQEGVDVEYNGEFYYYTTGAGSRSHISYCFKRAAKAFDTVVYDGNGTAGRAVTHNLQAIPEMMFVKAYSTGNEAHWVYHKATGNTAALLVNGDGSGYGGFWNSTTPSATTFTVSSSAAVNSGSYKYVAWLWATLDGVTKVGSYSGTGSNVNVDCGFSAGARFILIKRSNGDGDWYVWDSARGIVAGNDPYVIFEGGANTSTDYIDPLSSGFTVTSSAPAALNASGGTYIFLAIA